MFKTIDELIKRADELRQRKFEVKVNEKLLTVQYRQFNNIIRQK